MKPILWYLFLMTSLGTDVETNEVEKQWVFLAEIMRDQTSCISDPAEKLALMTDWLHTQVRHVPGGRYPRSFDRSSIVSVIKGGMGNCGYQASNIVGFAKMLGFHQHRVYHHRGSLGAPGDHAIAEILIQDKWILYDPDKFLYFRDEQGNLLGHRQVSEQDPEGWIGISDQLKGYQIRQSAKALPKTDLDYFAFESSGEPYIRLLKKMQLALSKDIGRNQVSEIPGLP